MSPIYPSDAPCHHMVQCAWCVQSLLSYEVYFAYFRLYVNFISPTIYIFYYGMTGLFYVFNTLAKEETKPFTLSVNSGFFRFSSIIFTIALPIITPSAKRLILLACSGVEMPKPTATRFLLCSFTALTANSNSSGNLSLAPVTPVTET